MGRIFPELASVSVENSLTGYVGFTFDRLPHSGVQNGLYSAMGLGGHGAANGSCLGSRLPLLVRGRRQDKFAR